MTNSIERILDNNPAWGRGLNASPADVSSEAKKPSVSAGLGFVWFFRLLMYRLLGHGRTEQAKLYIKQ
jgi:hypothetical protein